MARAAVAKLGVGRIPVADFGAFFSGAEFSPVEPFINPTNGRFLGFLHRLETDAITIQGTTAAAREPAALHSLKHALLNAAPAVTGLTQDEFGAHILQETGSLIFYDNVPGGSGGCRLLAEIRLSRWLAVARELAECHHVQCDDACRGCLFLPARLCAQGNQNLDRHRVLTMIP
jgi:ATP-dependent helicase YprA (DUF1998 family)